jgi:TolB-like protein
MGAISVAGNGGAFDLPQTEIRDALEAVLASGAFSPARLMCRLLRYLVQRRIDDPANNFKEYLIGLEVFGRDPASYNTADDPVVRVQIGRLRERLRLYYAGEGRHAVVQFSIPTGAYIPVIGRSERYRADAAIDAGADGDTEQAYFVEINEVRALAADPAGAGFAQGLWEEISDSLFHAFGGRIVFHGIPRCAAGDVAPAGAGRRYVLDGSVRIEGWRVRASFRLVDSATDRIAWSGQFDHQASPGIAAQQQLALDIRTALAAFFSPHRVWRS